MKITEPENKNVRELFTVIVLTYNNSVFLKTCLDSICKQDYPNIEIIVADDGSDRFDPSEYEEYLRMQSSGNIVNIDVYANQSNIGTVKSINRALKRSSGRYFKLIAADDALYSDTVLSKAAEALKNNPLITSNVMRCDADLNEIRLYRSAMTYQLNTMTAETCFKKLCVHNEIVAGGVFFTRALIDEYGYYDEAYRLLEDWPRWITITASGQRILFFDFIAIKYRSDQGTGTSSNKQYLNDKKRVWKEMIVPNRKRIGLATYLMAVGAYQIINSGMIRKLYALRFRKKNKRK